MTDLEILPITSLADVPTLAAIFEVCIVGSDFGPVLLSQFGRDEDGWALLRASTVEASKEGIESEEGFVFKVVDPSVPGGRIVGYSQWYIGRHRGQRMKQQPMAVDAVPEAPVPSTEEGQATVKTQQPPQALSEENEQRRKEFFNFARRPMVDFYDQFAGDRKVVCKSCLPCRTRKWLKKKNKSGGTPGPCRAWVVGVVGDHGG